MNAKPWTMKQTLDGLRYIAKSPKPEHGGFHPQTVAIAKSALHHIKRLREKKR